MFFLFWNDIMLKEMYLDFWTNFLNRSLVSVSIAPIACSLTFEVFPETLSYGGIRFPEIQSQSHCQAMCAEAEICNAFDFDYNENRDVRCYHHLGDTYLNWLLDGLENVVQFRKVNECSIGETSPVCATSLGSVDGFMQRDVTPLR